MAKNANAKSWTLAIGELNRRWSDQPFDLTAPSAPTIAAFGAPTSNSVSVSVTVASVDNRSGIANYQVELSGDVNGPYLLRSVISVTEATNGHIVTGLSSNTQYFVRLRGVDGSIANNVSLPSNVVVQTTSSVPAEAGWWPNWPIMHAITLQGNISNTLLNSANHSTLADHDVVILQSSYPTTTRIQNRVTNIAAVRALQAAPMFTRFFIYTLPSVAYKNFPSPAGQNEKEITKELLDSATKGHERWYAHITSSINLAGRVEDFFDPPATWETNVAVRSTDVNSLGETFHFAFMKELDARFVIGADDLRPSIDGLFMDVAFPRPTPTFQSNGTVEVTSNVDYNYNAAADSRTDWTAGANAGGRMWSEGQLSFKAEMEARFTGKFMIPNAAEWGPNYLDGQGAPALPMSNHPFYRKWEVILDEVSNFALGLRTNGTTAYQFTGGGSTFGFFRRYAMAEKFIKLDVNIPAAIGRGAVLTHCHMLTRTPIQDDFEFARAVGLPTLLNERGGPSIQRGGAGPFTLDEHLVHLGPPEGSRSMGTLNEDTAIFTLRAADQSVGVARFYWAIFQNGIIIFRGDSPSVGVWPSADAAVVCTLPDPGAGKKWQKLNASNYVNPITGRATRNQSPLLNNGADITTIALKPFHAILIRRVPV